MTITILVDIRFDSNRSSREQIDLQFILDKTILSMGNIFRDDSASVSDSITVSKRGYNN